MKSIEERIKENIQYQTNAEHLKDKSLEEIERDAEIIGVASYISEYIQWDSKKAINIAEELLEDVNLHTFRVVNLRQYDVIKKD